MYVRVQRGASSVPLVDLVGGDGASGSLLAHSRATAFAPIVSPRSDAAAAARSAACESLPPGARVGVQIRSLSKHYGSEAAVDDVSMNLAVGEITALLGKVRVFLNRYICANPANDLTRPPHHIYKERRGEVNDGRHADWCRSALR